MNYKDILAMASAYKQVAEKKTLDPVDAKELKGKHKDRKDKDIDNDGDVDKSDEYLHKRRKAVSASIKGQKKGTEVETEVQESVEEIDEAKLMTQAERIKALNKSSKAKMKSNLVKLQKAGKTNEEIEELDELSKKTLGSYVKKASDDRAQNAHEIGKTGKINFKGLKRRQGINRATDKLTKEAKDHGNMNNGSPRGEGLSPSAKKELERTTPMNPATDAEAVNNLNFKTFKAMAKKAPMRSNDNAQGDKTMPKNDGK